MATDLSTSLEIMDKLAKVERDRGVRIIYAAVVGSRAYGLEGPNSDCDVKFIYVHPLERYLEIEHEQEYIDAGEDVNGYDLRKFLQMVKKCGFNTAEIVNSPIVLIGSALQAKLQNLVSKFMNQRKVVASYIGCMHRSKKCFENAVEANDGRQKTKHALSAIRLYLSGLYAAEHCTFPPVDFNALVKSLTDDGILSGKFCHLPALVDAKHHSEECAASDVSIAEAMNYADALQERIDGFPAPVKNSYAEALLDSFFKEQIGLTNPEQYLV